MPRTQALKQLLFVAALLLFLTLSLQVHAQTPLHHRMEVEILPGVQMLKVTDHIRFPAGTSAKLSFLLSKKLKVRLVSGASRLLALPGSASVPFTEWGVELAAPELVLEYSGVLDNPVVNDESEGLISPQGAVLMGSTYWYPAFPGELQTFEMGVRVPAGWTSLTQGQRISSSLVKGPGKDLENLTRWSGIYPQQDLYLMAGPFTEYDKVLADGKTLRVLLRQADPPLAQSFLNVIPGYLDHDSAEIADYPYNDFSVVENFWETGFGMPAFTLLGPTVIRLPFLLTSSLPHEILHNWWGNSVYVDVNSGNWCEGLTTYMADHWQQEVNGQDADYRLGTLINYEDFVKGARDFPLRDFKEKMDSGSQAVGYGKSMMFFHMLKVRYGADVFRRALQDFYAENKFRVAGFDDIRRSFEKILKLPLSGEFSQWLERTGGPEISLGAASSQRAGGAWTAIFSLAQDQAAATYDLNIPVDWTLSDGRVIHQSVRLQDRRQNYRTRLPARPVKIEVDPRYDVFRALALEEHPATLSAALGSQRLHVYYPLSEEKKSLDFVSVWKGRWGGDIEVHPVQGDLSLSGSGVIVLMGDDSRFAQFMKSQLAGQDFDLTTDGIRLQSFRYDRDHHSWLLVARNRQQADQIVVWLRWDSNMPVVDWAQRLLHYGKYSALVFEQKPNVLKITWPVVSSPLRRDL